MIPRIALAVAALMAAAPAFAQSGTCATGGPNNGPRVVIQSTSTDTSRVPRMGTGSDLLTQQAVFRNNTAAPISFTVTLMHRAFQTNFVAGQTLQIPAGGTMSTALGNVVRPGLSLSDLQGSTTLNCN